MTIPTSALALRPDASALPSIANAPLPPSYEQACTALAACERIDECKDWADKAAALASYAKQADDPTLHRLAMRISSRAIRRCGELLEAFQSPGARTDQPTDGDDGRLRTQRQAADAAGLSPRQELTARRVATVPAETFESLVESDDPPSVTRLAELGTTSRPTAPVEFSHATHVIGVLHELVLFCAEHDAASVGRALLSHEGATLRADTDTLVAWLRNCLEVAC